jgi:hypothetical protein
MQNPIDGLSLLDVRRALGVTEVVVARLVKHGFLKTYKIGSATRHWVAPEEFERFRKEHPTLPTIPYQQTKPKVDPADYKGSRSPAFKALKLKELHEVAMKRGGKCFATTYNNSMERLTWECANGHTWLAPFSNVKNGKWCKRCFLSKLHGISYGKTTAKPSASV